MNCKQCHSKTKTSVDFWVSKIDAIGMTFIGLFILLAVWLVSAEVNELVFSMFRRASESSHSNVIQGIITLEVACRMLTAAYFYYIGPYKYGLKVAKALSYFLNFSLTIEAACKTCGHSEIKCRVPSDTD